MAPRSGGGPSSLWGTMHASARYAVPMTTPLTPGALATVRKYGSLYECAIVRATPTRYLVRFVQRSGRTVERWVQHEDVLR
jgi:hypothetical protein